MIDSEKYKILEDISYTSSDIAELIGNSTNKIPVALMFGATLVCIPESYANSFNELDRGVKIELLVNDEEFSLDDYQEKIKSLNNEEFINICVNDKKELLEKILSFKSLQYSWDGYGAVPLEVESAANAIAFIEQLYSESNSLKPSDLFPNPNGTISCVWENEQGESLSLEIGNQLMSYYVNIGLDRPEFYNNVEVNEKNIYELIGKVRTLF